MQESMKGQQGQSGGSPKELNVQLESLESGEPQPGKE